MITNTFGLQNFYKVSDMMREAFNNSEYVNTVTYGNIFNIDLSKQTIFPFAHIQVNSATHSENVITYNISIMNLDIVDISKDEVIDVYYGNDNLHYVYNTQLSVINEFIQLVKRGSISRDGFQLNGDPNSEAVEDNYENLLAGWVTTLNIDVANNISVCD
jgi:hypothetical protein